MNLDSPNRYTDTDKDVCDTDRNEPVRPVGAGRSASAGLDIDDPHVGKVLNERYRVIEKLGRGGHGYVYSGVQIATGRRVAIKLLRPESLEDPELEGRFKHEGLVMCGLKNAHTITTYDVDQTDDGTMYIVMELLEGFTLGELIDEHAPLAWRRALRLTKQMCEALTEAHACSIVHRDLKPANIFVDQRPGRPEFVKVLDFGIAKILEGEPFGMSTIPKLTARGQTIGTLFYMSPEQLLGTRLNGRSDVYALGVLTFEILTGRLPFPDAKKPAKLISAQLRREPPKPSTVVPESGIPDNVDELVLQMLAKESELRPDAAELLARCEEILARPATAPVPEPPRVPGTAGLDTEARTTLGEAATESVPAQSQPSPHAGVTGPAPPIQLRTLSTDDVRIVRKPPIAIVSVIVFIVVVAVTALAL